MTSSVFFQWNELIVVKTKAPASILVVIRYTYLTYELKRYTYVVSEDEGAGWVLVVIRYTYVHV